LIELGVIRDLVAIFGVIAGFTYYVMTVRNAQRSRDLSLKAQEHALETRKAQHYMQLLQMVSNEEFLERATRVQNLDISTYKEFNDLRESSFEDYMKFRSYVNWMNGLGHMMREGLIDRETIASFGQGIQYIRAWQKWYPIFQRQRKEGNAPDIMSGFEYLVNEMKERRIERGLSVKYSEEEGKFI